VTASAKILPWGRSRQEYQAMFALNEVPWEGNGAQRRILDVGGGPSSFTAEMHADGWAVTACDPIYNMTNEEISARIEDARREIMDLVRAEFERFVWTNIASPEDLERQRLATMGCFFQDYDVGLAAGRYRGEALPKLDFAEGSFDLVLCSHLLFTYSSELDLEFHFDAIEEMSRVGGEVRVFPLLDDVGKASVHLEPLMARLARNGYQTETKRVGYEFQRGGNQMLRVEQRA